MIPKTDIPGLRGKSLRNPGMVFHETGAPHPFVAVPGHPVQRLGPVPPGSRSRSLAHRSGQHSNRRRSAAEHRAAEAAHTSKRRKTPPRSHHTSAGRQRRTPGTGVGQTKPSAGSSQRAARNQKPATPAPGDMLRPASFNRPPDPPAYASPILGPAPGTGFGMGISILPIELS